MKLKRNIRKVIFIASSLFILHDFYIMAIEPIITSYIPTYTWFGVITLLLAFGLANWSYDSLKGGK